MLPWFPSARPRMRIVASCGVQGRILALCVLCPITLLQSFSGAHESLAVRPSGTSRTVSHRPSPGESGQSVYGRPNKLNIITIFMVPTGSSLHFHKTQGRTLQSIYQRSATPTSFRYIETGPGPQVHQASCHPVKGNTEKNWGLKIMM